MYLSQKIVEEAYSKLIEIDTSEGKSRKEKVSGLRYFIATNELLKKHGTTSIDLSVDNRDMRKEFIDAVAEVVCIDSEKNYSKDFSTEFGKHKDFGVGSNFFTTRLANSRSQQISYPGRPSSLLLLDKETISIEAEAFEKLLNDYSLDKIKAPLSIWLLRNTNFEVQDESVELNQLVEIINNKLEQKYTVELSKFLQPSLEEITAILDLVSASTFSENKPELSKLISLERVEPATASNTPHVMTNDLSDDDEVLVLVKKLLERGSKGILFSGPPGTSKTWYALKIALKLIEEDLNRLERVQFHPSYSYEDFIEGLVSSGSVSSNEPLFKPKDKTFINLCKKAQSDKDEAYFLIIDEFTRGDPSKIFGELLTYIESDYRDLEFILPYSEKTFSVPQNIIIFATMNPYDKSVVDLDAAMERRFEVIELAPNVNILTKLLNQNGVQGETLGKMVKFFNRLNTLSEHGFGHTYFKSIKEEEDLILLWNHKLRFLLEKMFRFKEDAYKEIKDLYLDILSDEGKGKLQ